MKHRYWLCIGIILFFEPLLLADETMADTRLKNLEKQVKEMKMQIQELQKKKMPERDLYLKSRFKKGSHGPYVTGEWLYWKTYEGGIEYAAEFNDEAEGDFVGAKGEVIHGKWNSGYRAGLGIVLPYDQWDFYLCYTSYDFESSSTKGGTLFPLFVFGGVNNLINVSKAEGRWRLEFQTVDFEWGKDFYISKKLSMKPFIGAKGASIDQKFDIDYTPAATTAFAGEEFDVDLKNDFIGGGLRGGIYSNWYLSKGFSFFGEASGALLFGRFHIKQEQDQGGVEEVDIHTHFHRYTPTVQLNFGIAWDTNFDCNRFHFGAAVGFESQYWWRQNQLEQFTNIFNQRYIRASEDLSLHGLTVEVRIDF